MSFLVFVVSWLRREVVVLYKVDNIVVTDETRSLLIDTS